MDARRDGDGPARPARGLGFEIFAVDAAMMDLAGDFNWSHRDPFDRMIAATCIVRRVPLVSKDATLDGVPGGIRRVW